MTKVALKKWLEAQKSGAICTVSAQRDEQIKEYINRRDQRLGTEEMLSSVLNYLTKAADTLQSWERDAEAAQPGLTFHDGYYCSIYNGLQSMLTMDDLQYKLRNATADESEELKQIRSRAGTTINGIRSNYDRVIANVSGAKNAKDAVAYLEELGFDLSELAAKEAKSTALMAQVDTRFLFLTKEEDND